MTAAAAAAVISLVDQRIFAGPVTLLNTQENERFAH